jgi:hypothetical protein
MSEELMPEEVRNLIMRHIDSVAQLEALLFLHARSSEQWDVATVAKRLYAPLSDMASCKARRRWFFGAGQRALPICAPLGSGRHC